MHKINVLDSLRAFAAISVCLFHFINTTTDFITTEWILNITFIGQAGVNLFFVVSGFIIPWSMYHSGYSLKNFFTFFLKRIIRLEPPYLISICLALIIFYLRANYLGKTNNHIVISGGQVALHIGYLIPFFKQYNWLNMVYWTLAIEFQYYLLIALLFIPLIKSNVIGRLLIYIVVLCGSFILNWEFIFHWLPMFFLGILLFLHKTNQVSKLEYYLTTFAFLCFCIFKHGLSVAFFCAIPVFFILYASNLKIYGLHFLGKFSYSIYLIHPLLGSSLINLLSHKYHAPTAKLAIVVVGIVVSFVGAWLMYVLVERPTKKFSAAINYKNINEVKTS